jgi:intracellular septation protein A
MRNLLFAARPILFDALGVITFAALLAMHVDFLIAIGIGASIAIGIVLWELARGRSVAPLQWMSLALVLISAAATYLTHDPRYVMAKPTVVYLIVGCLLLRRGWMNRYVPQQFLPLVENEMTIFGYVWAGLMILTAALNLVAAIAFTTLWPMFIAIFPITSKLALFAVQFITVRTAIRAHIATARAAESTP